MYRCENCGTQFREPSVLLSRPLDVAGMCACPECGSTRYHEIAICPRCERETDADELEDYGPLCADCRKALREVLEDFCDSLSKEQLEQVDIWMDGGSIFERENWR